MLFIVLAAIALAIGLLVLLRTLLSRAGQALGFNQGWIETSVSLPTPIQVSVRPVAVGGSSFVIMECGGLWAWGNTGALWNIDNANLHLIENPHLPAKIRDDVVAMTTSASHSFLITTDGALLAKGTNRRGQLGNGTREIRASGPYQIMENVTSVSPSFAHTAAITQDGTLWMWGDNEFNWRGSEWFSPAPFMYNVIAVSTAWLPQDLILTMAITSDLTLYSLDSSSDYSPAKIMYDVIKVASSSAHTLAITSDGVLWGWRRNNFGQLGDGTTAQRDEPVRIMENVIAVSTGSHTLAITSDGKLWAWGDNGHGQLGDGTMQNRNIPILVMENVIYASTRGGHSMAIAADGNVWAWGENTDGCLGIGTIRGAYEQRYRHGIVPSSWPSPIMIMEYVGP